MEEQPNDAEYVEDVVPSRIILRVATGTVLFSVLLCVIAFLLLREREARRRPSMFFSERQLGAPHDVSDLRQDLFDLKTPAATLKERQARELESFSWADQEQRLVKIPIERAIDLVVADAAKGSRP